MLKAIPEPKQAEILPGAALLRGGPPITPVQRIVLYSDREWEAFIWEWAHGALKHKSVQHTGGAGDKGIDIAGFDDERGLLGVWHNYQCKHYDRPVWPSDVWADIGKILWHSYNKEYAPPRSYSFVAPKGCGNETDAAAPQ